MSADDRNAVPRGLWLGLIALAGLTVIAEFLIHHHGYFGVDEGFAFYGWYTLVCAVTGVFLARAVGAVLGRGEDYHD
jgi:uncharacterized membrane protein